MLVLYQKGPVAIKSALEHLLMLIICNLGNWKLYFTTIKNQI